MNQAQTFTQTLNRGLGHPSISRVSPIVFVVDDDATVRDSLELLILSEGWQPETFQSAREFLSQPRALVPSCLIVDLSLSNLDGLELQKIIARDRAEMPIIFITDCGDIPTTVQAIKAGAVDFLVKPFSNNVLLRSIREGLDRSRVALDREVEMRELRNRHALLTPRERQVMTLVVSGLLNKQAGGELGISEITVKAHRGQVMQKMKANSLAGLVRMAADLHPARQAIHLA
ncbi:MAG TPA: response regulator [Terriglobales bacterium]|jgi:FixJ family two-component response regulator|nr:response regulator [Terriglobales bacterium]